MRIKRFGRALGLPSYAGTYSPKKRMVTVGENANIHWPFTKRDPRRVKAERRARNRITRAVARFNLR